MSTAVRQLEAWVGTQLLHRTTRRVRMTEDGRVFYERCKDVLADVDELEHQFSRTRQSLRGRLRVDMPSGMARHLVLPVLPAFLDAHPQIELELSATDRRVDLVREGFDCVIRVGGVADSSLVARPLGAFRVLTCASPGYLARCGTPRSLDDLRDHRLIHYASSFGGPADGFEYPDAGGYRELEMKGALTVNSAVAYEAACLAGLGLIQAPLAGTHRLIEQGLLVEVLPELQAEPMPVTLLYPHRRHLPRRVSAFMDWVAEVLRPHLAPIPDGR